MVGDGEAETGPLATSWHSNKFLNPVTDGVVLPILHLNGYKIANPTVLARISRRTGSPVSRVRLHPYFVEGRDPRTMHQLMAAALDAVLEDIRRIKARARRGAPRTSALAHDRAPDAEKAGPVETDRRQADRGLLAFSPSPDGDMDKPSHIKTLENG